ncbi:MAG: hypothetical protein C4288_03195 [Leptolyngbya sp. ERB_1_1]
MSELSIVKLDDSAAASELAQGVAEQFVLPTFSEEGRSTFPKILARDVVAGFSDPDVEIFGVRTEERLVGYIAIARKTHISQLFVAADQQQKGIGRMLLDFVEQRAKAFGVSQLTVRASLNAVPFYKKCGFEVTADAQEKAGIRFQPMQKTL